MYFAHFTVSGISVPLLCDSVFASCCGKHNTAMIARAFFGELKNTAEEPKRSLSLSNNFYPPPPAASVSPLPRFQPRYSASMIANMHNDSVSRGPAEVPHWCWETLSCRHIAGKFVDSVPTLEPGELWQGIATGFFFFFFFFYSMFFFLLLKWRENCAGLYWNSSLLPPITRPGRAPCKYKHEYIIK